MTNHNDPRSDPRIGRDGPRASLLDQHRLDSMADEGGCSGALMEIEDDEERRHLMQKLRKPNPFGGWRKAAAAFALVGVAVFAWGWLKRNA